MYAPVGLIPLFIGRDAVNKSKGLLAAPIWPPARWCELGLSDREGFLLSLCVRALDLKCRWLVINN